MKLVLATPPFDIFKEGYGTKKRISKGHLQPLGVGYIAAAALKAGIETAIVDSSVLGLDVKGAVKAIREHAPDAVGISTLTSAKEKAFALASALKKELGVTVILGGPHATCFPEEIMRSLPYVDYVVMGEGDRTIAPLLRHIENGTKPYGRKGVVFRDAGAIVNNGNSEIEPNLDNLASPSRHLYKNELYSPLPYAYKRLPATTMITSRGCPYSKCTFCFSSGKMKKPYRRHSPERVVEEIKHVTGKFGIKEIIYCDDNFLVNKKWIMEYCRLLKKNKINITWSCTGRADSVDPEMLKEVKSAGCWTVFYGFEAGVQRLLDIIKKGITVEQIKNAAKWTHEAGIETRGSFIFALPGETPEDAMAAIKLAISMDLDYTLFHAAFPEPGTELFETAKTYGRFETYRGMSKATFIPEAYKNAEEVENMTKLAYRKFYFRPRYILKRIMSVKRPSDVARYIEGFLFLKGLQ